MVEQVAQALVLAFMLKHFVDALLKPAIEVVNAAARREPVREQVLALWPLYVTVLVAGALAWFAGFNILPMLDPPVLGRVLTALAIGLGPSFLHDLTQHS